MKPYSKNAGPLLREALKNKGWSHRELGHVLGYCRGHGYQFISNIVRGKCNIPAAKVKKIESLLSMEPGTLAAAVIQDAADCMKYEIEKASND